MCLLLFTRVCIKQSWENTTLRNNPYVNNLIFLEDKINAKLQML